MRRGVDEWYLQLLRLLEVREVFWKNEGGKSPVDTFIGCHARGITIAMQVPCRPFANIGRVLMDDFVHNLCVQLLFYVSKNIAK